MRSLCWIPVLATAMPVFAQFQNNTQPTLNCDQNWSRSKYQRVCDMREMTMPATGSLKVDASPNGAVTVRGWNKNEVWVRARLEAISESNDPRTIVSQVNISASASQVRADGPRRDNGRNNEWWSVSFEIFVPHKTNLTTETVNGGTDLSDLEGQLQVDSVNGGVNLTRVAGDARIRAVNGGINVNLESERWMGTGLDVHTTNGGVTANLPGNFSARVSARTNNGGISTDFPVSAQGEVGRGKELNFNLGSGGAPIRFTTTNGGIKLKRKGV